VKLVGNGRDSGLHDDAHDTEANDGTRIYGGLSLGVVEMCWHNDGSILDGPAKGRPSGVMTTFLTVLPRDASTVSLSLISTIANICSCANHLSLPS